MIFCSAMFHIDDAFRDYVVKRLLPLIHKNEAECVVEVPLSGKKSCIRIVKTDDGKGYAVRAFPKGRLKQARHLYHADDFLEKNNVPAPRLVDFAEAYSSKGVTFVAEEMLDGVNWDARKPTPELAKKLAALLSRLHSVNFQNWGGLMDEKSPRGSFGTSQLRRVGHRLHRVKKFVPEETVTAREFRFVKEWFRAQRPFLDVIEKFQLIHDKLNGGNVMICGDGEPRLYLLDFATLRRGYRGKDVIQAERELLSGDEALIGVFREEYFKDMSEKERDEFAGARAFYRAYYHLSRSAANIRRDYESRAKKHVFKQDYYDRFVENWRALWSMMEGGASEKNLT